MVAFTRRDFGLGALAVGACATWPLASASAQEPKKGGTLVYATVSGPGTLDPYVSSSAVELEVIHSVFEGLVALDNQNATRPMLASKAEASSDFLTYTFALRKGVKFHNGQEMNSADVKASFERYQRVSPNANNLADIESYETPDPYTITLKLKKPNVVLLDVLKSPIFPFMVLPADQKDKPMRQIDIIGTGPYSLGEWVKDSHLVINRFDGYVPDTSAPGRDGYAGRKTVHLDAVRFRFIPEANARVAGLQTGEVHLANTIPPELRARVESRPELAIWEVFPVGGNYIVVNSGYGLTANVAIRQAISTAINTDEINDAVGVLVKPNGWMSFPGTPYYLGETAPTPWYNQNNPAKAKEMLKAAGYKGEKLVIETNNNYPWMKNTMLVVSEQLKAIGMNVEVQLVDWTTNATHMQMGSGEWNLSTTLFGPDHILGPQQWRPMIYSFSNIKGNEALDATYAEFFTQPTLEQRRQSWLKIQQEVLGKGYMIKVADAGRLSGYNRRLMNRTSFVGILQLWDLYLA